MCYGSVVDRLPRLALNSLRAAVTVRDAGSVTEAARRLGTSQPVLSRLLAALEAELGFPLFSRAGRAVRPAPAAGLFLDQAAATLIGAERLGQLAIAIRAERVARVKLAGSTGLMQEVMPSALEHFARARPGVEIDLQIRRRHEILEALDRGAIDFGLVVLPVGQPGLTVRPFASAEAICLLPAGHPLATAASVTPADLGGQDQVCLPEGSLLRRWTEDVFAAAGVTAHRRVSVDSNLIAARLVAAGFGFAVTHPVRPANLPPEVVARPFRPALPFTYALVERTDIGLGGIARELEEALRLSMPGASR